MKKTFIFILAIIIIILIFSCSKGTNNYNQSEESCPEISYDIFVYQHTTSSGYNYTEFISVQKFTFEDHDYILMRQTGGHGPGGLVHDPNCKTCKKD